MILYLSSQQHTNLLDFLAEKEDALPVKKMTGNFMLKQFVIYDMRNFSHCTELVLDRIAFGDEDRDFAQAIEEFLTMYNARITVICEGLKESNPLCRALLDAGVGNIVTDVEIRGMQEEIMQSLSSQGMTRYAPKEQKKNGKEGRVLPFHGRWSENCHDKFSEPYRHDYYGVGFYRVAWKRRCKCGLCGEECQRHHSLFVRCL